MATSINAMEIPVSTVQGINSSYTVPADRYAIVRAQVKNGGTLSIAGTVVLATTTWNTIANNNGLQRTPGTFGANNQGVNTMLMNGVIGVTEPTATNTTANTFSTSAHRIASSSAATSVVLSTQVNATTWTGVDIYTNSTATSSDSGTFKVPPGTAIVGAVDARYHIELYRVPGSAT